MSKSPATSEAKVRIWQWVGWSVFAVGLLPVVGWMLYWQIGLSAMFAPTPRQEFINIVIVLIINSVAGFFYFFPAIVGRKKRDAAGIAVWNLFLGWTIIGWIVALVWAFTDDT